MVFLLPLCEAVEIPRFYYLGDCLPASSPIGYLQDDPALDVIAVPATAHQGYFTTQEVARALRIYMPRTYAELLGGRMVLLSDVRADSLPVKYLDWFSRSITEEGMTLMMIGGILSFGGYSDSPSWDTTSVGPLLPVALVERTTVGASWKPVVVSRDDPLMAALPWATSPFFLGYNKVTLKEGAKLLAETSDVANPFMAVWDIGTGRTFAFCTDWTPGWGAEFMRWAYYPDFTVYSVYYVMGREVPQDLDMMHRIRLAITTYGAQRDTISSLIAFVERVGANTGSLERLIGEADDLRMDAGRLYVLQDYPGCLEGLKTAQEELAAIEAEAMKVRSRTMLWIWMVEWFVVTATLMIAGSTLWALMVKKRLYREMGTTRSR